MPYLTRRGFAQSALAGAAVLVARGAPAPTRPR